MSIIYSEVSASGVDTEDFGEIFDATGGFLRTIEVQRHSPSFSLHDQVGRSGSLPFTAAADSTKILRAYNNAGSVYVEYLLSENVVPATLGSWSSPTLLTASAMLGLAPKVVKQASSWDVIIPKADGTIYRYTSTAGTGSWTNARFGMFTLPVDGSVVAFTYGGGIEVAYYWAFSSANKYYNLRIADSTSSTSDSDTEIYWFDTINGFDCLKFTDSSDDAAGTISNLDIRHTLVLSAPMPAMFSYKNIAGTPTKGIVPSGGIVSFTVRPPNAAWTRPIQVSHEYTVQTFDKETSLQYRRTAHVSGMSSLFGQSNPTDTLYIASFGGDGDINGDDTSYGYTALYYYSSRDNKNWSMNRIVPIDGIATTAEFDSGVCLLRCNNYVYMVSATTTLRSLASAEFGTVHPSLSLDISSRVMSFSSSMGDMRQTTLTIDNKDNYYGTSILLDGPSELSLITKIGRPTDDGNFLFQVSVESIDAVTALRERPNEYIEIQARDRMSWLTDRSESPDSIIHDHILTASDTFSPIGGEANTGLRHVAAVSGTFATDTNTLKIISNYKEGIEFSTFNSLIVNGSMECTFLIPRPEDHALPGETVTNGNNHAYAGFVFHALDKDNLWFCYYDYWAQGFSIGYRKNGKSFPQTFIAPSAWFKSQASGGLEFTFRIEYRYNKLYIYYKNALGINEYAATYSMRGRSATYMPMQEGSCGLIGCGFSDEDTGQLEPDPTIVVSDGPADNIVPSRMLILMADGRLIRATGTNTGTGSPVYELVAGPCTFPGFFGDSARSICNDPYEPDTIIILDPASVRRVKNVWGTSPVVETLVTSATPGVPAGFWYFVGNLTGSINRKNWFGWLGHGDNGGGNQSFFYYTTNNFVTINAVHISDPGGFPDGEMNLIPGLFNTTSKGVLYCQEGTAGIREFRISGAPPQQNIWKSTNWGLSWSALLMCYPGGGAMNIYYKKRDGSNNTDDTFVMNHNSTFDVPQGYVEVTSSGAMGTFTVTPPGYDGSNRWYYNRHYLNISTDNGLYQAVVNPLDGLLHTTSNGWATEVTHAVPGNATGLSGYPPSPNYYVAWTGNNIQMTFDRGSTWWDIGASLTTWWAATIGGGEPGVIYVYADLAEFYDAPKWNGT